MFFIVRILEQIKSERIIIYDTIVYVLFELVRCRMMYRIQIWKK